MRIATSQLYTSTMQTMEDQQSQLLELQQQVSSGVTLLTPGNDPVGAAKAVQLSATSATLDQYTTNQNLAQSSLNLEDTTLSSVASTLTAVNTALVRAGDGSLSDSDRAAIAQQLEGDRNQLLSLANTTDGDGTYVFSGFQTGQQPFTSNSSGGVTYSGDSGLRLVQVSGSRQLQVNDSGASVFMSVSAVGSSPVSFGSSSNTGTGTITSLTVPNPGAASNNTPYNVVFSTASGSLTYDVYDTSTNPPTALSSDQPYTAGQSIALGSGMNLTLSGTPADGDSFSVEPANQGNADIFAAINSAITALQQPVSNNEAASATLQNAMTTAMTQVQNALSNVTTVQAAVAGREQELTALQSTTSTSSLQVQSDLSDVTSTNMISAISQYLQLQNALTASQKSFAETQGLSLFQYINP